MDFPAVNQLHEPTADAAPDENANNNCVTACLAACMEYWTGHAWDGDELKDAVYGQGYTGPMSIDRFTAYSAAHGVKLLPIYGSPATLIAAIHASVWNGIPTILTIPSQWGAEPPPTTGYTHVVVAYEERAGEITCMNPWGGFAQTQPDAWWMARVRFGVVWQAEAATMAWTIERDAHGVIIGGRDAHGATVGGGIAAQLEGNPAWLASDAMLAENYFAKGQSIAVLSDGAWFDWNASRGTVAAHRDGGDVVAQLYQLTEAAATRIVALQAELSAAAAEEANEANTNPLDSAAIAALRAALAAR